MEGFKLTIPTIDVSHIDFTKSSDDITIEEYFTKEEFTNISDYEKLRFRNIKQNYLMMMKIGLPIIKPDFMKSKRGRKRPPPPPSDSSSDEEWLPSKERQRDRPKRAVKPFRPFVAPFKAPLKRQQKVSAQSGALDSGATHKKKAKPSATVTSATVGTKDVSTKAAPSSSKVPTNKSVEPMKPKKNSAPLVLDFLGYNDEEIKKWRKVCMLKTNKIKAEIQRLEKNEDETLLQLVELELQKEEEAELAKQEREAPRYPKRNIERTNYKLLEVPDDDEFLFCEDCNLEHKGDCPIHGPLIIVEDRKVESGKFSAELTAPYDLVVRKSKIPGAGHGVWTTAEVPKGVRFGPYAGRIVEIHREHDAHESGYAWMIYKNEKPSHFIDAGDVGQANWMRYVNCARFEGEQNVTAFQYLGQIYYRTFRPIPPQTEVLVWYGESYASELGIDVMKFHSNGTPGSRMNENANATKPTTFSELLRLKMVEVIKYKCPICWRTFYNENTMEEHRRTHKLPGSDNHHGDSMNTIVDSTNLLSLKSSGLNQENESCVYKCDKCYKCFAQRDEWQQHMMSHNMTLEMYSGEEHKCTVCEYRTNNKSHLTRHMRSHTGEKPYKCTLCDYRCNRQHHLTTHMRTHTGEKPYKCTHCDYRCNQQMHLTTHMRTHTGEKPYKCTLCDYRCYTQQNLTTHMRTHTDEKPYKCTLCDYRCNYQGDLTKHMRTHTGEKPYKCTHCDYRCNYQGDLTKHMRTHTDEKPYKCTLCDFRCNQQGVLTRHMRTHTGEKPYKCTLCDYRCNQQIHLTTHMRTHTGEKPYKCTLCDYRCNRQHNLTTHMRTHTGEKPYKCTHCDYRCNQQIHLTKHMRTHTGEKPYKCTLCDYRCNQQISLTTHMRTHTGEKPYKCTLCDYRCNQQSDLTKHIRTHTGEKPYKCTLCDYRCSVGSALRQHTKAQHNDY